MCNLSHSHTHTHTHTHTHQAFVLHAIIFGDSPSYTVYSSVSYMYKSICVCELASTCVQMYIRALIMSPPSLMKPCVYVNHVFD